MYQSTSVAAAWDCLRRGDVNGAVGASAASRASSSGTSATGRVTDVAASRRRRCSASQCRRRRAKTQSSQSAPATTRPQQTPILAREDRALIGPRNPDVVARLFGGRFDAWATFPHQRLAGVPDPAFWLVMEYWRLGDWRRPRA